LISIKEMHYWKTEVLKLKEDEKRFLIDVYKRCANFALRNSIAEFNKPSVRDLINEEGFYIHYKRAWYLLKKWSSYGWYNYGVALDLGWLTREGERKAQSLL
jgi:hypothetical protein